MLVDIHKADSQGNVYTLKEELRLLGLTIPVGFESDGASVPRFFWRIVFPPGDTKALKAAFVHDFIYRTHPRGWTKEDADSLFLNLMISEGVSEIRATVAYLGVKFFGRKSWEAGGQKDE